jgi:hypothetical protein
MASAITTDICKECGSDIWPGDTIARVLWRQPAFGAALRWLYTKATLCEDCGVLYKDSQEMGKVDAS